MNLTSEVLVVFISYAAIMAEEVADAPNFQPVGLRLKTLGVSYAPHEL